MRQLIDLTINEQQLEKTVERAKEKKHYCSYTSTNEKPRLIPDSIKEQLKSVNTEDLNPLNLFRNQLEKPTNKRRWTLQQVT